MFFEGHHSREREHFYISKENKTKGFPLHIHRAFECYGVKSGSVSAVINGVSYKLFAGDAVLVFPYQRHEYIADDLSDTWFCIFSPDLVSSFNKGRNLTPVSNKFRFSPPDGQENSLLLKKALCYKICGIFDERAEYTEERSEKEDLLSRLLHYISKNFNKECDLKDVASSVGYDYSYISKFFKRMTGQSFKSYVTDLRVGEACRLLRESDRSVSDIAELCGFGTTRSLNRAFLELTGICPRDYRKR